MPNFRFIIFDARTNADSSSYLSLIFIRKTFRLLVEPHQNRCIPMACALPFCRSITNDRMFESLSRPLLDSHEITSQSLYRSDVKFVWNQHQQRQQRHWQRDTEGVNIWIFAFIVISYFHVCHNSLNFMRRIECVERQSERKRRRRRIYSLEKAWCAITSY